MRYKVMDSDQLEQAGVPAPKYYDSWQEWKDEQYDEPPYFLVDTVRGVVVYEDGGEPEDFLLTRNLRTFVDELNRLAEEKTATTTWEGK